MGKIIQKVEPIATHHPEVQPLLATAKDAKPLLEQLTGIVRHR